MTILIITLLVLIYLGASLMWFLKNLGRKFKKDDWKDYFFYPGMYLTVYPIAFLLLLFGRVYEFFTSNRKWVVLLRSLFKRKPRVLIISSEYVDWALKALKPFKKVRNSTSGFEFKVEDKVDIVYVTTHSAADRFNLWSFVEALNKVPKEKGPREVHFFSHAAHTNIEDANRFMDYHPHYQVLKIDWVLVGNEPVKEVILINTLRGSNYETCCK